MTAIGDPMVGRTVAHYDIQARVGSGGMGVVYQARDIKLGRTVALKFLPQQWSHDENAKQRFFREAQAASATNHPNICTIHDVETADDGQLFIVMAYYEGQTLKQRLEAGPLNVGEALDVATQVADGLAKAHAQGVVHRDIKPGNLMLTEDGVRILDFGLATFADALKLTIENSTLGTAAYMSPEQVRGQHADARSDVWAVGVVLYEMLAGHVPFQGSHAEAIAYAVRNEAPAPLRTGHPDIREEVEQLVFRAVHKEPSVRYQNGRELARALRHVRGQSVPPELRTEAVRVPGPLPVPVPRRRLRKVVVASLVVVAAGALAGAWWFRPIDRVSVVIAPVANQTGDASLQPYRLALTHALERRLAESRFVRVVPHPELVQMLRKFLSSGVDVSSRDAIQAISTESGASVVVVPALLYENGSMRARAEFLNPATATPTGEPYQTGSRTSVLTKDTASELIEALAVGIEERFRNGRWTGIERAVPSARFRTLDAGKAFEEGISAFEEFEYSAARSAFQAAASEDPRHPLVAAWTSRLAQVLGDRDAAAKAGAQALALLSSEASRTDRLFVEGVVAEGRGDADTARATYQELADRFRDEPTWLMELAAFHDRRRETAAAIETYHRALSVDGRLARPHLFLCRLYNSTGTNDAGLARKHGERAREAYAALGAIGGEAQALLCLADILRLGDAAQRGEARRAAAGALTIYERLGWPYNLARSYHYAAMAAGKDDIAAAAALWEQSLVGAREVGNGALEAAVLVNLGVKYHELGDIARALDYYRQSFQLNEKRGDDRGAAYSRANAGALMVQSGNEPDEGLRYLETALKVFTDVDSNFEMFCRQNIAEYYRHTGQFALADRELTRAFDISSRHGFVDDVPLLLLERARLKTARGEYGAARADLLEALKADAGPETEMRIELGLVETLLGDVDAARQTLGQAEREIRTGATSSLASRLRAAIGVLEYESGRWSEARSEFERASRLEKSAVPDPAIVEARAYAGVIEARNGRMQQGRRAIEDCVAQARQRRRVLLEARCRLFLARIAVDERRGDEAVRALTDVRVDTLGPELQAQVHYWRARASALLGRIATGESGEREARRLLTELRESVPAGNREGFARRLDIRQILQ